MNFFWKIRSKIDSWDHFGSFWRQAFIPSSSLALNCSPPFQILSFGSGATQILPTSRGVSWWGGSQSPNAAADLVFNRQRTHMHSSTTGKAEVPNVCRSACLFFTCSGPTFEAKSAAMAAARQHLSLAASSQVLPLTCSLLPVGCSEYLHSRNSSWNGIIHSRRAGSNPPMGFCGGRRPGAMPSATRSATTSAKGWAGRWMPALT